METDKHYFIEGLFIIGFALAIAGFFLWLTSATHRDDILYRIQFAESVSGLALGDPVKFHGVDVGAVKSMTIDPTDPRLVAVDVSLRKDTPVKTDTTASLKLKGFTGVVFIELDGGSTDAMRLVDATPSGSIPEIRYAKSTVATVLDELPKVLQKLSALEDRGQKVLTDMGGLTAELKENPSLLIFPPKQKSGSRATAAPRSPASPPPTSAELRGHP